MLQDKCDTGIDDYRQLLTIYFWTKPVPFARLQIPLHLHLLYCSTEIFFEAARKQSYPVDNDNDLHRSDVRHPQEGYDTLQVQRAFRGSSCAM